MGDDLLDRLVSRIEFRENGCWIWPGATSRGAGVIRVNGKNKYVHRLVWSLTVGPLTEGLVLDHIEEICGNRACCNPDHLEEVSLKENTLRGIGIAAENAAKVYCKNGHEFTESNTRYRKDGTGRYCLECKLVASRKRRDEERAWLGRIMQRSRDNKI